MPQNKRVRLKVATAACDTTLYTIIEGARQGGIVFKCLCLNILGPNNVSTMPSESTTGMTWENQVVVCDPKEDKIVHFVDMDATIFSFWLDYLRTGDDPDVPDHLLSKFVRETERSGLTALANMKFHVGCVVAVQKTFTSKANKTPTELTKGMQGELVEIDGDGDYKIKWQGGSTNYVFKSESLNIQLVRTAQVCMCSMFGNFFFAIHMYACVCVCARARACSILHPIPARLFRAHVCLSCLRRTTHTRRKALWG